MASPLTGPDQLASHGSSLVLSFDVAVGDIGCVFRWRAHVHIAWNIKVLLNLNAAGCTHMSCGTHVPIWCGTAHKRTIHPSK